MQLLFPDKATQTKIDAWMKTIKEDLQNSISDQSWTSAELGLRKLIEHYEGDRIWVERLRGVITDKKKFRSILLKARTFGINAKQVSDALNTYKKNKNLNAITEIKAMMDKLNKELIELQKKHTQPRLKHVLVAHLEKIHNYIKTIDGAQPIDARKIAARIYRHQNEVAAKFESPVDSSATEVIRSMLNEKIDRTISDEGSLYISKFRLVLMLLEKKKIPSGGGYISEELNTKKVDPIKSPTQS